MGAESTNIAQANLTRPTKSKSRGSGDMFSGHAKFCSRSFHRVSLASVVALCLATSNYTNAKYSLSESGVVPATIARLSTPLWNAHDCLAGSDFYGAGVGAVPLKVDPSYSGPREATHAFNERACKISQLIRNISEPFVWLGGQGASCDAQLSPLRGTSSGYMERGGNRCEGLYVAQVGSQRLEMVSFVWGSLTYSLTPGTKLTVSVPGINVPAHVRAVAIPPGTFYRMDTLLGPGASLAWSVDDVLLPEGLDADRIGVYSWTGEPGSEVFLPVRAGNTAPDQQAVLAIRPSFDVVELQWRIAPLDGATCAAYGAWKRLSNSELAAGQSFRLSLGSLRGPHCIEVSAKGESGWTQTPLKIRVEIPEI